MASFQFRLHGLLTIRQAARDQRQAELAAALASQRVLDEQRATLQRDLEAQQRRVRAGAACGRINIGDLLSVNRYEFVLRRQLADLASRQRALAEEIERLRDVLTEAQREVRVLEKLRERQLASFRQQEAVRETKQLDEAAQRSGPREF